MRRPADFIYPALPVGVLVAAWFLATHFLHVSSFLLPKPEQVALRLAQGLASGDLLPHILATLSAAIGGFLLGSGLALAVAAAVSESRWVDRCLYLPLVGIQSMPKIAVSPIIAMWVGFGLGSMVAMAAVTCFFPVFANSLAGFRGADKDLVDLYRVSGGSRLRILFNVKLPTAASAIFSGLQVAAVLALIGTVVMEFLIASRGLGFLIMDASTTLDSAQAYAAILLLGVSGAAGTQAIRAVGRRIVFWNPRASTGSAEASN